MSAFLASDAMNPEFVGAHDPDARLSVRFYKKAIYNEFESNKQGKDVLDDVDFVEIMVPGDRLTVIDTIATDYHKKRFPRQWLSYQMDTGSFGGGTKIEEWNLTPAQIEELHYRKFFTIEQIANASDAQIQAIGMIAGMGGHVFRDRARKFLIKPKADSSELDKMREEHAAQMKEMQEKMDALLLMMKADIDENIDTDVAVRRGRKPKE